MIETLQRMLLPILGAIQLRDGWDSLIINRRKPHTYRAFRQIDGYRVCLHKFDPCDAGDEFPHPHPWPAAFLILNGSYMQRVGVSQDLKTAPTVFYREILKKHSMYEITDRHIWHTVQPLQTTYTIMVNGQPWESPHSETRTTKGKDLEKMSEDALADHLSLFEGSLSRYLGGF